MWRRIGPQTAVDLANPPPTKRTDERHHHYHYYITTGKTHGDRKIGQGMKDSGSMGHQRAIDNHNIIIYSLCGEILLQMLHHT